MKIQERRWNGRQKDGYIKSDNFRNEMLDRIGKFRDKIKEFAGHQGEGWLDVVGVAIFPDFDG